MGKYRMIALFLCLVMVLGGCRQPGNEPSQALPTEPAQTTEATQETTAATEPVTEATQEATEVTEGPQWGPEIHSGLRSDGTFNSGTLFIGDSLTYGLVNEYLDRYGFLGEARYMAIVGVPVGVFFNQGIKLGNHGSSLYSPEFRGMSYCDAVASVGHGTDDDLVPLPHPRPTACSTLPRVPAHRRACLFPSSSTTRPRRRSPALTRSCSRATRSRATCDDSSW